MPLHTSRRAVLSSLAAAAVGGCVRPAFAFGDAASTANTAPLQEFSYAQVRVHSAVAEAQRSNAIDVLLGLDDDALLRPFRAMAGQPAPGASLGGWYEWKPDYDPHHDDAGLAPGHSLGQWIGAMARLSVQDDQRGPPLAAKARRLTAQLQTAVTPQFFAETRFAAYTLEKFSGGMVDAHRILQDPTAYAVLAALTQAAQPALPPHAVDREVQWAVGKDSSWLWDESFTLPENYFRAAADTPGQSIFAQTARNYLDDDTFFAPLARGENRMADRHAYSYVNALNSAMQAYLSTGSDMHLRAAQNGFAMLQQQSFSTGGWGPDELLRKQGYDELIKTLSASHNSFEVPCGSYAHTRLTRSLLRVTRDGRYGDSMERVLLNTTSGILPLQPDGRIFYYADYNWVAQRIYSVHRWPCCSGTFPLVAADYGINTFLRSPGAVWVNLYQPSELRFQENNVSVTLAQDGTYPMDGLVRLRISADRPVDLTLQLRIPDWAVGATLHVNQIATPVQPVNGFAALRRTWRTGDLVELTLPMPLRLEALPANGGPAHPDVVSLLYGPLVLMAVRQLGESGPLALPRTALLAAERTGAQEWTVHAGANSRTFVPFQAVGDRLYSAYVQAT